MTLYKVAQASDFAELEPIYLEIDGAKIAVYRYKERYFAYLNKCPHQAGPACEGALLPTVEGEIFEGGGFEIFDSKTEKDIVCPWHGVEFDLETGACRSDDKMKLRAYKVFVEREDVMLER